MVAGGAGGNWPENVAYNRGLFGFSHRQIVMTMSTFANQMPLHHAMKRLDYFMALMVTVRAVAKTNFSRSERPWVTACDKSDSARERLIYPNCSDDTRRQRVA